MQGDGNGKVRSCYLQRSHLSHVLNCDYLMSLASNRPWIWIRGAWKESNGTWGMIGNFLIQ